MLIGYVSVVTEPADRCIWTYHIVTGHTVRQGT